MIALLLISLSFAAFLNAVMDALFDHFDSSIFRKLNPNFWNPNVSWKTAKRIWGYPLDSWHISKSLMLWIMYVPFAVLLHQQYQFINIAWLDIAIWWVIVGLVWCTVFNKFFNKWLKAK